MLFFNHQHFFDENTILGWGFKFQEIYFLPISILRIPFRNDNYENKSLRS
nr:translational initiation factor 1 [Blastus eglandulosus]UTM93523.1 translational initiation factor 1 [Blastus eglandulosus]